MAAFSEQLRYLISLDADGAIRGFEQVGRAAERDLGRVDNKLDQTGRRMQLFGAGSLAAAGIVGTALYGMSEDASNLEQAIGGAEAVFGSASDSVIAFADTTAESLGISNRATLEMTTQLGSLLTGMGLTQEEAARFGEEVTRLGADAAAAFGGAPQEAVAALGATFRGEYDSAERFGASLNAGAVAAEAVRLGLAESTTEVDAAAKAQATLSLITDRLANVQGQAAREAETLAGQQARANAKMEEARASIGATAMPLFAELFSIVGDGVEKFGALNEATDGAAGKVLTYGTIALGAVGATSSLIGSVIRMRENFSRASDAASGLSARIGGARGLTRAMGAAGIAGAAFVAADALGVFESRADDLTGALDDLDSSIQSVDTALVDLLPATSELVRDNELLADALRSSGVTMEDLTAAAIANDGSFEDLRDKVARAADEQASMLEVVNDVIRVLDKMNREVDQAVEGQEAVEDTTAAAREESTRYGDVLDDLTRTMGSQREASDQARVATDAVADAADRARRAEEDRTEAIEGQIDATLRSFSAALDYEARVDSTAEAIAEYTQAVDTSTTSEEDLRASRRAALDDILGQAAAYAELNATTDDAVEKAALQRDELARLRDSLAPDSPLRSDLSGYIATLEAIPGVIETSVNVTADTSEAQRRLNNIAATLSRITGENVRVTSDGGFRFGDGPSAPEMRARGGFLNDGSLTVVGEEGPELVRQRGNQLEVLSNPRSRAIVGAAEMPAAPMAPANYTLNVHSTSTDDASIRRSFRLMEMISAGTG